MACTGKDTAHEHDTYTCPMHPTVISDRPGNCPVCGMDLVRKARPGEAVKITEDLSGLIKSPNEVVVSSIKTIQGEYKSVPVVIQAQGIVTYDTRHIFSIPARVSGRVERSQVKHIFQKVSKGEEIAKIYSPELITAQRELLFLLQNDAKNTSLVDGARKKLELLGMSSNQIGELTRRGDVSNTITTYSPYSGYVITGQQTPPTSKAMRSDALPASPNMVDGMASSASPATQQQEGAATSPSGSLIREGDYVAAGQTLFTIVDNKAVRIELDVPGSYSSRIKQGTKVELNFGGARTETAIVDFVQPFFTEGQEFLKIRVHTSDTDGLHIGHLVNANIHVSPTEALWVPKDAVLFLGLQSVVFISDRGVFKPKEVTTGITVERMIEIKSGLASSDKIAASAQFLVDSESFIKPDK